MRAIHAPDRPLVDTLYEFTYGLVQDKLAEVIYRTVNDGPDKGYYTFDRFKFKRRESWKYVVDAFGNTPFIAGLLPAGEMPPPGYDSTLVVPGTGGNCVLMDRDRFAIFSWAQRDSDPRCRPILRRAYNAWNLKIRTWPEKLKGDVQFGTPTLLGEVAENAMDPEPDEVAGLVNADGTPVSTAEDLLAYVLTQVANGTAAAVPNGTKVQVIESQKDGASINASIELYNREIAMAILHAPRATQEAMHGSKADAQTATDVTQGLKDLIACLLAGLIRNQWLKPLVRLNEGAEAAEWMLPEVMNGEIKSGDLPGLLTGMAAWVNTGMHTPSQLPSIDAALGLPVRNADELTIRESEQQFQAEQAEKALEEKEQAAGKQESAKDEAAEDAPTGNTSPQATKKPLPQKTRPRP
jgi:hypothetical protein